MASKINKKFSIAAQGVLHISDKEVSVENEDSGELIALSELFEEFADKEVKLSITYGEDY